MLVPTCPILVICRPHISPSRLHKGPFKPSISPVKPHIGHLQGPNYWSSTGPTLVPTGQYWSSTGLLLVPTGPILVIYRPILVPTDSLLVPTDLLLVPTDPILASSTPYSSMLVIYRSLIGTCKTILIIYRPHIDHLEAHILVPTDAELCPTGARSHLYNSTVLLTYVFLDRL